MFWRDVLKEMGFMPLDNYSKIYFRNIAGEKVEFSFSGRDSTDAIFAEIWDVAQRYGEKKAKDQISRNIFS